MAKTRKLSSWEMLAITNSLKGAIDREELHVGQGEFLMKTIERAQSIRLYFPEPPRKEKTK